MVCFRHQLIIATAAILIIVSAARHGEAGDKILSFNHGGLKRSLVMHEPKIRPAGKCPLLIALHGGGGTGRDMIRLTQGRFNELADANGFYVVYPDGHKKHWNDMRRNVEDSAHLTNVDDTGFLSSMIDRMKIRYGIDGDRIFVTGISNGGFMSLRLACELSTKIHGAAIVCAAEPADPVHPCEPAARMAILFMNGTDDPLCPYRGGPVKLLHLTRGVASPTEMAVRAWAARNGCAAEPAITPLPDANTDDGSKVTRWDFSPGGKGRPVVLYRIEGGGHTWPGGRQYLSKRIIGTTNRDINACDEIWKFFSSLR